MELVTVLPSAEDEVNVACFHPSVGSGLVYGTKVNPLSMHAFGFLELFWTLKVGFLLNVGGEAQDPST